MDDCTVCGWELEEDAWFCSNCSVPVHRLDAPAVPSFRPLLVPLTVETPAGGESATKSGTELCGGACPTCGKTLSLVERGACWECTWAARRQEDLPTALEQAIARGEPPPDEAVAVCRRWSRTRRRGIFHRVCKQWIAHGAHDEASVSALHALMLQLELDPGEVHFEGRIRLHLYADRVRHKLALPLVELREAHGWPVERLPHEAFHYFAPAVHYEPQIQKRRYVRGGRPSLPGGSGPLRVQVAGTRGDVLTEKEWSARTTGVLLITSCGLRLHAAGTRRLFIPLTDIVSHTRARDRVLIGRSGRADPYVFQIPSDGPSEIVELCLKGLLGW